MRDSLSTDDYIRLEAYDNTSNDFVDPEKASNDGRKLYFDN